MERIYEWKKKSPSLSSTEVKIKIGRFSALYMRFLRIVSRPLSIATGPWEQGAGWWGSLCLLFQLLRHSQSWSRWLPPSRPIGGMLSFYRIQAWFLQNFVLFLHFFSPPNFSDFCSWSNSLMFSGWDFPWTSVAPHPPTHPTPLGCMAHVTSSTWGWRYHYSSKPATSVNILSQADTCSSSSQSSITSHDWQSSPHPDLPQKVILLFCDRVFL